MEKLPAADGKKGYKKGGKHKGNKRGRKQNWAERRRNTNKNKKPEGEGDDTTYSVFKYSYRSLKFDLYYRAILDPLLECDSTKSPEEIKISKDEDFRQLRYFLKQKLPITFRVNPINVGFENITRQFSSETFVKDWTMKNKDNPEFQGKKGRTFTIDESRLEEIKIKNYEFYPDKLLYELPLGRDVLKKDTVLTNMHKFIQK